MHVPELRVPPVGRRLTVVALCALVGAALPGCAALSPRDAGPPGDVAAVKQVVEDFRVAILAKDRAAYMKLFFSAKPEDIGWQAVVDDAALAAIRRERPQAIKARPMPSNNFVALIDSVLASSVVEEERIRNVSVDTDGEVASAGFDYAYLSDGKVTNVGRELWQLVRTEQGWKIFSVVYTIREPDTKP